MHWDIGVVNTIVADSVMIDHDNKKYISWKPLLAESPNMFSNSVVIGLVDDEYSSSNFVRHTFSSSIHFLKIKQITF